MKAKRDECDKNNGKYGGEYITSFTISSVTELQCVLRNFYLIFIKFKSMFIPSQVYLHIIELHNLPI